MLDWRQSLAGVDEDYLVGISNKGIVKRAYKDMEAAGSEALAATEGLDWNAQELTVAAGGETVTIRFPLGECQCSCPSRSICRHVVMAILLARQAAETSGAASGESAERSAGEGGSGESAERSAGGGDSGESAERSAGGGGSGESAERSAGGGGSGESAERSAGGGDGGESAERSAGGGGSGESGKKSAGGTGSGESVGQMVWQEILTQPRKPLLRALGSRALRRLVSAMEAETVPQVERGTVVRMRLPGQDITVKLLSPLEYSACTCHKKELCSHKAEAILWCQYLEKQLTVQELAGELEQEPAFDLKELRDAAGQVKDCLEHLLETGLARSGTEQAQELERLAILCHNAGLPGWEGDIRALAEGYERYLRRAAGQTMEKLAGQLQRLYEKTVELGRLVEEALSRAGKDGRDAAAGETEQNEAAMSASRPEKSTASKIQALAGEFRSEYLPVGNLELTGITVEHFVTDSGYEGDTVYFLEMESGTWYTYTSARPTFYEGKRRTAYQEKAPAPWGIPLSLEGLAGVRLQLQGAKCDAGGRLSSTQETRGEILGKSELTAAKLEGWYYRDYGRLFAEQIPGPAAGPGGHTRLAFVQAARFERGHFNEISQKLELPIWDKEDRQVMVELPYSKRDEASIRYLERLKKKQQPCFLGRVYLQDSRICLYPVDLLERKELEGAEYETENTPEYVEEDGGENPPAPGKAGVAAGARGHDREACQALQSFLEEVSWLLQEIYQVGSATVQDSTLEALRRAKKQGEAYGMTTLGDWLRQLEEEMSKSRHRLRHQPSDIMGIFCRLWQYVQLCRQRTTYDIAGLIYRGR